MESSTIAIIITVVSMILFFSNKLPHERGRQHHRSGLRAIDSGDEQILCLF